jgi:head-tail adaptor
MLQSFIRRGELDREVTFIKKDLSTGASNADHIDEWVEVDTDPVVSARRRDVKGDVVMSAERLSYSQRTVWTVDYRTDLSIENRLVHGGKVYEIIAITENGGTRETYIDVMTSLLATETWT